MNKREAHWIHDDKGGYWQIPVGGKPYNFRTPPGFVMHPKGEAVTDAEILWDMRHIDDHLKYSEDASSMLIQGVRKVLRRVMRPTESQAQGGGECCHSWQDYGQMNVVRCNKCEARAVNGYEDRPFTAPPSAPVGVEVKVLARDVHYAIRDAGLAPESPADDAAMRDAILRTLAQQPAADRVCPNTLQACRCDKYTPCAAQQPAAVDEAMVERIAALLHEEATDEPWTVAGVEHEGPDRGYYRKLARKVIVSAGQQPASVDEESVVVPRWFMEKLAKDTRGIGMFEMSAAIRRVALAAQPGGSDNG